MKLCILNDLHNEFEPLDVSDLNSNDFDVLILAGDTDIGIRGAKWAVEKFLNVPIIYIAGNHEYYGKKIPKINSALREISSGTNLYFLENDELILGDVRFLGCTLWTDFKLYGQDKFQSAVDEAQKVMTDYHRIRLGADKRYRKLRPSDTIFFHYKSTRFLEEKLIKPFEGSTVVITHHSPSPKANANKCEDLSEAAFSSNLEWLILNYKPNLWIHGHVHKKLDYQIGDTRVICNSRGYAPNDIVQEFRKDFFIEI